MHEASLQVNLISIISSPPSGAHFWVGPKIALGKGVEFFSFFICHLLSQLLAIAKPLVIGAWERRGDTWLRNVFLLETVLC